MKRRDIAMIIAMLFMFVFGIYVGTHSSKAYALMDEMSFIDAEAIAYGIDINEVESDEFTF